MNDLSHPHFPFFSNSQFKMICANFALLLPLQNVLAQNICEEWLWGADPGMLTLIILAPTQWSHRPHTFHSCLNSSRPLFSTQMHIGLSSLHAHHPSVPSWYVLVYLANSFLYLKFQHKCQLFSETMLYSPTSSWLIQYLEHHGIQCVHKSLAHHVNFIFINVSFPHLEVIS